MPEIEEKVVVRNSKNGMTIFWSVLLTLLILGVIFIIMKMHRKMFGVDMAAVNSDIASLVASPPYPFPVGMTAVTATTILTNQVNAMVNNPAAMKTAQSYSQLTAIPLDQVIVNEAYYQCHSYGWL